MRVGDGQRVMVGVAVNGVTVGQGVQVAEGVGGVAVGQGVHVDVGVNGVAVGQGVRLGEAEGIGVSVMVAVAVGMGVGGSPSIVKNPTWRHSRPTKICTWYSPGSHSEGSGSQSV